MMNRIKKILLAVTLMAATLALYVLAKVTKPTVIKTALNQYFSELTEANIDIGGEVSWQFLPRPGLKVTNIHSKEDTHHPDAPQLSMDELVFHLELKPLFQGKLIFNEVMINGFKLQLTDKTSVFVLKKTTPPPSTLTKKTRFAIHRFLLTHGQISVIGPNHKITLKDIKLDATHSHPEQPEFSLHVKTKMDALLNANTFKATLDYKGQAHHLSAFFTDPCQITKQAGLVGQLLITRLRMNHLNIAKISATTRLEQGHLQLNPMTVSLYKGQSVGAMSYQFASKKMMINQTMTGLDANQLLSDLVTMPLLQGQMDALVHATIDLSHGHWLNHLQGNGHITIKDGVLCFVDLQRALDPLMATIRSLFNKKTNEAIHPNTPLNSYPSGQTPFQLLTIQYQLSDHQFTNNAVVLETKALTLKGNGDINLTNLDLNQSFTLQLTTNDNPLNTLQSQLGGSFPFSVRGTLKNPAILPDLKIISPLLVQYTLGNMINTPVTQIKQQFDAFFKALD